MIIYLIKSGVCLGIVLAIYQLVLEREKMHEFNRFYLLFGLCFSFVAPLITLEYSSEVLWENVLWEVAEGNGLEIVDQTEPVLMLLGRSSIETILSGIYVLGLSFFLIQFIAKLSILIKKVFRHQKVNYKNAQVVLVKEDNLPHTFLNFIFINQSDYEKKIVEEALLLHELTHARQKHSLDVLMVEVLKVIFWFNPLLIFYKRAIQLNHEFLADDAVLKKHQQVSEYQHLLLDKAASNNKIYLASNLNFLVTKKRLKMMTKKTSRLKVNALATMMIPLFVGMLLLFGNKVEAQKTIGEKEKLVKRDRESVRDAYFKDATFVIKESKDKTIYKTYADLTDEERKMIPPPPPPNENGTSMEIIPLPKGALVHYDMEGKNKRIWIDETGEKSPPPPPPVPPKPPKAPNNLKPPPPPAPPAPPSPEGNGNQ